MPRPRHNLRFKEGDLAIVRSDFKTWGGRSYAWGPRIVGSSALMTDSIVPGKAFLVLSDAKLAAHTQNRKIYIEVMTDAGPKVVWASAFKMRRKEEDE